MTEISGELLRVVLLRQVVAQEVRLKSHLKVGA